MKTAVAIVNRLLSGGSLKTWMEAQCSSAGITLQWHDVSDVYASGQYDQIARSAPNVISWNFRKTPEWMRAKGQNVLFLDHALISQKRGVFVDHGGLFAESNLCAAAQSQSSGWPAEFYAFREFGWTAFEEGDKSGPILVCLQCEQDSSVKSGFLRGQRANRMQEFLQMVKNHLPFPHSRVLVRQHPREKVKDLPLDCIDPAWEWQNEGSFPAVLRDCRAVVTINSTCAHEAVLAGVPVATMGTGTFTGWGVTLECASDPARLASLASWTAPRDLARNYVSRAMTRHFLPYDAPLNRSNAEFQSWMEACT